MDFNVNISGSICISITGLEGLGNLLNSRILSETPKKSSKSQVSKPSPELVKEPEAPVEPDLEPETSSASESETASETAVTPETVQSKARQLATSGKQAKVREIILSLGIQKISDLPLEKCAEALAALEAIE